MTATNGMKIGLALSGGGYRAAAFHLGTLRKLDQLKHLHKVDVLSTVSGGSIVGAAYVIAQAKAGYSYASFESSFIKKLQQSVIGRVLGSFTFFGLALLVLAWLAFIMWLQFTPFYWTGWIVFIIGLYALVRYQFKLFPVSKIIEGIYDSIFYDQTVLGQLPASPEIVINSTNLSTGIQFSFSKSKMNDSTYEFPPVGPVSFLNSQFPVARAVMASSCVPFAFTPVPIDKMFFMDPAQYNTIKPVLVDGGVYDNQGIHKLTVRNSSYACQIVITSDAGNKMPFGGFYGNVLALLLRCMDLFMNRIKKFQISSNLYDPDFNTSNEIAYISLGWDISRLIPGFIDNLEKGNIKPHVIAAHNINPAYLIQPINRPAIQTYLQNLFNYPAIVAQQQNNASLLLARNVGTNLTALSLAEINALINQAELMTELQIKLYCPSI